MISKEKINEIKARHSAEKLKKYAEGGGVDLSDTSPFEHTYGTKTAISKLYKYNNCVFVIEKKIIFKGRAVDEHYYCVSLYRQNGEFVKEMESTLLVPEFFDNLIYI